MSDSHSYHLSVTPSIFAGVNRVHPLRAHGQFYFSPQMNLGELANQVSELGEMHKEAAGDFKKLERVLQLYIDSLATINKALADCTTVLPDSLSDQITTLSMGKIQCQHDLDELREANQHLPTTSAVSTAADTEFAITASMSFNTILEKSTRLQALHTAAQGDADALSTVLEKYIQMLNSIYLLISPHCTSPPQALADEIISLHLAKSRCEAELDTLHKQQQFRTTTNTPSIFSETEPAGLRSIQDFYFTTQTTCDEVACYTSELTRLQEAAGDNVATLKDVLAQYDDLLQSIHSTLVAIQYTPPAGLSDQIATLSLARKQCADQIHALQSNKERSPVQAIQALRIEFAPDLPLPQVAATVAQLFALHQAATGDLRQLMLLLPKYDQLIGLIQQHLSDNPRAPSSELVDHIVNLNISRNQCREDIAAAKRLHLAQTPAVFDFSFSLTMPALEVAEQISELSGLCATAEQSGDLEGLTNILTAHESALELIAATLAASDTPPGADLSDQIATLVISKNRCHAAIEQLHNPADQDPVSSQPQAKLKQINFDKASAWIQNWRLNDLRILRKTNRRPVTGSVDCGAAALKSDETTPETVRHRSRAMTLGLSTMSPDDLEQAINAPPTASSLALQHDVGPQPLLVEEHEEIPNIRPPPFHGGAVLIISIPKASVLEVDQSADATASRNLIFQSSTLIVRHEVLSEKMKSFLELAPDGQLFLYWGPTDRSLIATLNVLDSLAFGLNPNDPTNFWICTKRALKFEFAAESPAEANLWLEKLNQLIVQLNQQFQAPPPAATPPATPPAKPASIFLGVSRLTAPRNRQVSAPPARTASPTEGLELQMSPPTNLAPVVLSMGSPGPKNRSLLARSLSSLSAIRFVTPFTNHQPVATDPRRSALSRQSIRKTIRPCSQPTVAPFGRASVLTLVQSMWSEDEDFVKTVLLTHPTFIATRTLWAILRVQFKKVRPFGSDASVFDHVDLILHNRVRIVGILHMWVELGLVPQQLQEEVAAFILQFGPVTLNLLPQLTRDLQAWAQRVSQPLGPPPNLLQADLDPEAFLWSSSPEELAKCFTMAELDGFTKISAVEFLAYIDDKATAPHLSRFIELFTIRSRWLSFLILRQSNLQQQLELIIKLAQICEICRCVNNFSGVLMISSAIFCPQVYSLYHVLSQLPRTTKISLRSLSQLMSPDRSYQRYFNALNTVKKPPCIPYIGTILREVISIDECHPDTIDGLVNSAKLAHFYNAIKVFFRFHHSEYAFELSPPQLAMIDFLKNPIIIPEEELDELSAQHKMNQ